MRRRSLIVRLFRHLWGYKLTPAGKGLVATLLLGAIGSVVIEIAVYQVSCTLLGVLLVTEAAGLLMFPRLEVRGKLPDRGTAGERLSAELLVTNNSRRPVFDIMAAIPGLPLSFRHEDADCYLPVLWPGQSATLPVTLLAGRRGIFRIPPIRLHSTFPFNLMRVTAARVAAQRVVVQPAFHPLEACDVPLSGRYQPGGMLAATTTGHAMEYVGNREYVSGEPAMRMDFRAWARLGKPVVREYQDEFYCRVALVLDTYVAPSRRFGVEGRRDFEAAISLMAAVNDFLTNEEHSIDLFAAGPEMYVFRLSPHRAHFEHVLEILASVQTSRHDPFAELAPEVIGQVESLSSVVCIFLDWNESREQFVETVRQSGCHTKVLLVRSAEPTCSIDTGTPAVVPVTAQAVRHGEATVL